MEKGLNCKINYKFWVIETKLRNFWNLGFYGEIRELSLVLSRNWMKI